MVCTDINILCNSTFDSGNENHGAPDAEPPYEPNLAPTLAPSTIIMDASTAASSSSSGATMDVLAAVFFVIAAGWLLVAVLYACLVLAFLRIRARGDLDSIYEEDFGRFYLFGSRRFYIPLGWILRRYVRHLQRSRNNQSQTIQVRFMTRDERRAAMEVLLHTTTTSTAETETSPDVNKAEETEPAADDDKSQANDDEEAARPETLDCDGSMESPVCSICLGDYEEADEVLESKTCSHQFHKECILDWLQRDANIECPCCRVAMVSEDDVWKTVQRLRKARRKQIKREKRKQTKRTADDDDDDESVTEEDEVADGYDSSPPPAVEEILPGPTESDESSPHLADTSV